jgi:hypothetical protein
MQQVRIPSTLLQEGCTRTWAVQLRGYYLIAPLVSALIHTPSGYSFRFEFIESGLGEPVEAILATETGPLPPQRFQLKPTKGLHWGTS